MKPLLIFSLLAVASCEPTEENTVSVQAPACFFVCITTSTDSTVDTAEASTASISQTTGGGKN